MSTGNRKGLIFLSISILAMLAVYQVNIRSNSGKPSRLVSSTSNSVDPSSDDSSGFITRPDQLPLNSLTIGPTSGPALKAENSTEISIPSSSTATSEHTSARNAQADSISTPEATEVQAPRLSERVVRVMQEVQARQQDSQWEEALNEMNALYTEFDTLNPLEQSTLLNFYTNTLINLNMLQESISAFSLLLTVQDLQANNYARALRSLGQLHGAVGENQAAIAYLNEWLDYTAGMDNMEQEIQRVHQLLDGLTED
ncbi:MAG: hypothetical protein COC19_05900 [SAR86 cluster bacterium]|uniref:Tetratricopeptide repeat-like domain-containing protein n=1 Tax=SAR86 cluster bacterium TaxID=2030880 RepID=A0A2A4MKE7_9GAMM|nr:MAG: hypothetical protein COC19_05900 [SAR86 cluster bacterium]